MAARRWRDLAAWVATRLGRTAEARPLESSIADFLQGEGVHGVSQFTLSPGVVRVELKPWEGEQVVTVVTFHQARITSLDAYPDEVDNLDPPWDVIAFDGKELGDGRWEFVLHCGSIEWGFESAWPVIERVEPRPPEE